MIAPSVVRPVNHSRPSGPRAIDDVGAVVSGGSPTRLTLPSVAKREIALPVDSTTHSPPSDPVATPSGR